MFSRLVFSVLFCIVFSIKSVWAQPMIVVSIAPLHSVVSAVMKGVDFPELLLDPAVSVHDYHLKPSDMQRLARADFLFWGGEELESFLQKPLISAGLTNKNISFLADPRLKIYPARGEGKSGMDGHFWLDPENMIRVAEITAEKLAVLDPDHASLYRSNALLFSNRMTALKEKGKETLAPYVGKTYITFHDAYQYFEKSFNLKPLDVVFIDAHHEAGAGHIASMREKIKQSDKVCLFAEPQFSDKRLKVIAEDLPVIFGELDPIGFKLSPGPDFYTDLMDDLIDSFIECFSRLSE